MVSFWFACHSGRVVEAVLFAILTFVGRLQKRIDSVLKNCYDAVGVMLLILITQQSKRFMELKRAPCLDAYFERSVCPCFIYCICALFLSSGGSGFLCVWSK